MNNINDFDDKEIILRLFEKELLPLYPDFQGIKSIKPIWHKRNIWESTYHVVVEFRTVFIRQDGRQAELPIFCTAHSSEPRRNVYDSLKFLWDAGFGKGWLSIPHPLFYSEYYNGTFYRGVKGDNLYKLIRENRREEIERMLPKAAAWFAKLHNLPTAGIPNFNIENSRIATVLPGIPHILARIDSDYPRYSRLYKEAYGLLDKREKEFLQSTNQRWLVHGDAHPENIIKMSSRKLAVIDFTDLCLSDFARDLGTFLQQIEYMIMRKINDAGFAKKAKKLFLEEYVKTAKIRIDASVEARIRTYYLWTMMRTATFFLVKYHAETERAIPLLHKAAEEMKFKFDF